MLGGQALTPAQRSLAQKLRTIVAGLHDITACVWFMLIWIMAELLR